MSDTLTASRREATGTRASQKLRAEGLVPAILYGHKEAAVNLTLPAKELRKALSHNAKVVELVGEASGQAVVQALQWDTFHRHLLHVDLLRVSKGEKVTVTVPVEMKGEAEGAKEGGVVSLVHDHVEIEAAPASIPEMLHVDVTNLQLGGHMTAGDIIDLPEGATLLTDAERTIATCVPPAGEPSLEGVAAEGGSPEVIGEKTDDTE